MLIAVNLELSVYLTNKIYSISQYLVSILQCLLIAVNLDLQSVNSLEVFLTLTLANVSLAAKWRLKTVSRIIWVPSDYRTVRYDVAKMDNLSL